MLAEAARRQRSGETFFGLVYAHQLGPSIGQCIDELELIAKCCAPAEILDRVVYLPL